jgi:hypothetical protein
MWCDWTRFLQGADGWRVASIASAKDNSRLFQMLNQNTPGMPHFSRFSRKLALSNSRRVGHSRQHRLVPFITVAMLHNSLTNT